MKTLTREELESLKAKAVQFTRDVRDDDDRADEIEDESLEDYAERRHIKLANLKGARKMPQSGRKENPSRRDLLDRVDELEAENEDLQSRLDEISDIVGDQDEDENGEDDDQGED